MQFRTLTVFVVCSAIGALSGTAFACLQGNNDFYCSNGATLVGWGDFDGRCEELRYYIPNPSGCRGCTIHTGDGYIEVRTPRGGYYTCYYGNDRTTKACEAYCLNSQGGVEHGHYECFTASDSLAVCGCDRECIDYN